MEKTLAREIYKHMELDKEYTAGELLKFVKGSIRHFNNTRGVRDVEAVAFAMNDIINAGYATVKAKPIMQTTGYSNITYYGGISPTCNPIRRFGFVNYYKRVK